MSSIRERVAEWLFGDILARRVENALKVVDDAYWTQIHGGTPSLDEDWAARKQDLDDALEAWRTNPLARRIVSLTSDYVVGSGIGIHSPIAGVQRLVDAFWQHNDMRRRCYQWCDELTRCGELFVVMRSDDVSGASFVRAIPAAHIDAIETDEDDLERELRYHQVVPGEIEGRWWPAACGNDELPQVVLHYAINRPVGCVRGDGDLGPILPWLRRYKDWLENRVRLNRYKTAFLWDVTVTSRPGRGDVVRQKRFKYKTPPSPGSIIVHDDTEKWEAVAPKIEAWDAKEDGKALRLAIAAGAGIPLHFLAEGESATRATAAEMGDPTFRHYYQRQLFLGHLLCDLLGVALRRAGARGRGRHWSDPQLSAKFPDVTKQDNLQLAQSAAWIVRALEGMARCGWMDRQTAVELAMRFAGEWVDVRQVLERLDQQAAPAAPDDGSR